jgi:amino acid transporter
MWAVAAAVTTTLPGQIGLFVPGATAPVPAIAIGLATLAFFCMVNCVGVKPAAGTATFLTVAKVVPLALLAVVGGWHLLHAPAAEGGGAHASLLPDFVHPAFGRAFGSALFAAFYPLQGFEVVPVPAGELANPRRDVPLAVTGALLLTAALYCGLQLVAFGAALAPGAHRDGSRRRRPDRRAAGRAVARRAARGGRARAPSAARAAAGRGDRDRAPALRRRGRRARPAG